MMHGFFEQQGNGNTAAVTVAPSAAMMSAHEVVAC